jgi:hypothetical protein
MKSIDIHQTNQRIYIQPHLIHTHYLN